MKVALFPGSFDPLTLGHLDIIKRGSALFDHLAVAVMKNTSKNPLFSIEERVKLIQEAVSGLDNVAVITADGLTVDLMSRFGADYLLRGLRNGEDFRYERDIAAMNVHLDPQAETVFMLAKPEYQHLSSSLLKEVAQDGGDISDFLPANVNKALTERLAQQTTEQVIKHNDKTNK